MTDKLREALERIRPIPERILRGIPVRDLSETLAEVDAALAAAPQPAPEDDWRKDPSADDRWSAGCDYAMTALCKLLRINTDDVTWDAATEELEGDVLAVLGNILTVRFGDDWRRAEPQPAVADREACRAKQAEPDRGFDETPYDRGYVWGYRHGLRDGKAEVAPQPAPERTLLAKIVQDAMIRTGVRWDSRSPDAIADALHARGLRLPLDPTMAACAACEDQPKAPNIPCAVCGKGAPPETLAWAVIGEDGRIRAAEVWGSKAEAALSVMDDERIIRVAIRKLEGGDDAT